MILLQKPRVRIFEFNKIRKFCITLCEKRNKKTERISYAVNVELSYSTKATSIAFVKLEATNFIDELESGKAPKTLLNIVEIGDNNPFATVHNYVKNAFEPFITSFSQKKLKQHKNEKTQAAVIENMNLFKTALVQCNQSVQIPDIDVFKFIHPDIKELVANVRVESTVKKRA